MLKIMKKYNYTKTVAALLLVIVSAVGCSHEYPIDEDGLLITTKASCYVSNFDLLGTDFVSVVSLTQQVNATATTPAIPPAKVMAIDTTALTISVQVNIGTDLKNLYPQFTLGPDEKLNPKITGKMDFSDLAPRKWTVISGNRKVKKEYTVTITVQQ